MSGSSRLLAACLFVSLCFPLAAEAQPKRVVIYGDSLASGFNLPEGTDFAWALRKQLYRRGRGDTLVMNTSRAGDTTGVGVDRLPLAFSGGADLVIVELGGNDMLGGEDPRVVYRNLDTIVRQSKAQGARVIVAGMVSTPKRDPTYKPRFDAVYPALAARQRVALYPFFLDGAFGDRRYMQSDGEHPNAAGSDLIAAKIAPMVERELRALDRRDNMRGMRGFYARAPRY
ncbi:arylesterase [Methylocystis parvus]|nr:arylesterase [Methylocystis parvus]WBJ99008.1 arylesterase [Methylocystis parvus OBBP]